MAFINRMDFIWWPTMLLCIPLMLLAVPMATAGSQTVLGVVGQQVFLNPGYFGDLSKSETLWKFEQGVKNLVPILDYVHGGSTEYPNEQFKSRLQYNASSGSLQVKNLRPEDRGNFIFHVAGQAVRTLKLIVIEPITTNISRISRESVMFPGVQEDARFSSTMVRWQKISENIKNKSKTITVWESFTGSSKPVVQENYKGRIGSVLSNASFTLHNIVHGDEGVYQLIIQPDIIVQTVHLIITVAEISWKAKMIIGSSLIALMLSLFYLGACLALRWKKPNQDYKSLIVCNILSFVFTIIALSFWINIKDHVFTAVVALCTVSFWFLAMIAVFVPNLPSLIKTVFHLNEGVPRSIDTVVIPVSIAIFGEMIQQIISDQCGQIFNLTWTFIISLVICFVIIICLCLAMFYGKAPTAMRNNSNEESSNEDQQRRGPTANRTNSEEEQQWQHNEELQDLTGIRSESFDGIN